VPEGRLDQKALATSTLGRTWRAKLPKSLRICRPGARHGSTRRARCAPS